MIGRITVGLHRHPSDFMTRTVHDLHLNGALDPGRHDHSTPQPPICLELCHIRRNQGPLPEHTGCTSSRAGRYGLIHGGSRLIELGDALQGTELRQLTDELIGVQWLGRILILDLSGQQAQEITLVQSLILRNNDILIRGGCTETGYTTCRANLGHGLILPVCFLLTSFPFNRLSASFFGPIQDLMNKKIRRPAPVSD